jgi:serine protease inhibitor
MLLRRHASCPTATRRVPGLPLLLLALTLAACTSGPSESGEPVLPRALTAQEQELVTSGNLFGLKLFRAVSAAEDGKNLFLSPLSVSMALGMTLNGAAGETRSGMEQALELAGLTEEQINHAYRSLIDLLTGLDRKVVFEIANSIWYREGFPISSDFIALNLTWFDAVVQALDFSDPGAADVIDAWVDAKTHGKIDQIVTRPIDPGVVMFLINAVYFKGDWTYRFDPEETAPRVFHLMDGRTPEVPTMRIAPVQVARYQDEEIEAVDLPYGDGAYSMTVLMPRDAAAIYEWIEDLDRSRWEEILEGMSEASLDWLTLPKFRLEHEITLNEVLKALGMAAAFGGEADFTRMTADGSGGLWIDEIKHKTFVDVNEEGTEAAAVTSVVMARGIDAVLIDRPFVFVLRERLSGTILFLGLMLDPSV